MTDKHDKIFFGQASALSISTPSKDKPFIFVRCIKKKADNTWEKPTLGEGKVIRLSLEEIVMFLKVLNKKIERWNSVHNYKDESTAISINWDGDNEKLWIKIGEYSKMFKSPQTEILTLLMEHLLKEKIKYATISNIKKEGEQFASSYEAPPIEIPKKEKVSLPAPKAEPPKSVFKKKGETQEVNGSIQGETGKALLLLFPTGQELWFPKSTIHSQYAPDKGLNQQFKIDDWILKKNGISA